MSLGVVLTPDVRYSDNRLTAFLPEGLSILCTTGRAWKEHSLAKKCDVQSAMCRDSCEAPSEDRKNLIRQFVITRGVAVLDIDVSVAWCDLILAIAYMCVLATGLLWLHLASISTGTGTVAMRATTMLLALLQGTIAKDCHSIAASVTDAWCNQNCNFSPPTCPAEFCV